MIFKVIACISICIGWGNAFEVFQPNRVEANNSGVARLRCNYNFTGKGEEFRITLFRGISDQTIVCASSFHLPNTTFETKEGLFSCQGEASRNSVDLTISGMSSSDTDFYKCRVEIMYPPPYRQRVGNGTVIYIPEIQTCPKIESNMEWIIVAVSGCIIACTVIIIAAILVIRICQQKWKADYVDMSPVISEKRNSNNRYIIL